ncbi:MAG TPA: carboxymuconolactone decarboxylase family protein [Rugosimonospora sp.]|nr:carboxymuconolactone decarboxylase family protein [Rugosimonospora sp.]
MSADGKPAYGRAPWPTPDELDPAQRAYYDAIVNSPRSRDEVMNAEGRLLGPFNARLLDPPVGTAIQGVGAALRFRSVLTDREREFVILTVARAEDSDFEWRAHREVALRIGITEGELGCIGAADAHWTPDPGEVACLELARELLETADISDDSFARAAEVLSLPKIFDVVSLVGHYRHTALALRVWRVPADPAGT